MSDRDKPDNGSLVPAGRRELAPVGAGNPLVSRGIADLAKIEVLDGEGFWNRFHCEWTNAKRTSPKYVKANWGFMATYVETLESGLEYHLSEECRLRLAEAAQEARPKTPMQAPPASKPATEQPERPQSLECRKAISEMSLEELRMELLEQPFRVRHPLGIGFWDCFKQEWGIACASPAFDKGNWQFMMRYVETLQRGLTEVREKLRQLGLVLQGG